MTRLTCIENVIEFSPLDVETPTSKAVRSNPDPDWGVNCPQDCLVSTGVSSNGFFVSVYTPDRTPSDSKSSA